jgi:hypothetical protein
MDMVTENIPKSQPRSLLIVTVRLVVTLRQAVREHSRGISTARVALLDIL